MQLSVSLYSLLFAQFLCSLGFRKISPVSCWSEWICSCWSHPLPCNGPSSVLRAAPTVLASSVLCCLQLQKIMWCYVELTVAEILVWTRFGSVLLFGSYLRTFSIVTFHLYLSLLTKTKTSAALMFPCVSQQCKRRGLLPYATACY